MPEHTPSGQDAGRAQKAGRESLVKVAQFGPERAEFFSDEVREALEELAAKYGIQRGTLRTENGTWLREGYETPYWYLTHAMALVGAVIIGNWADPSDGTPAMPSYSVYIGMGNRDSTEWFCARLRQLEPFGVSGLRVVE